MMVLVIQGGWPRIELHPQNPATFPHQTTAQVVQQAAIDPAAIPWPST